MLFKNTCMLMCRILGLAVLLFRGGRAEDAELVVLRHENVMLHAGRCGSRRRIVWFAALARLVPHRRWAEVLSFCAVPHSWPGTASSPRGKYLTNRRHAPDCRR
jgi:hypothetical protein